MYSKTRLFLLARVSLGGCKLSKGLLENARERVVATLARFFEHKKRLGIFDENLCAAELKLIVGEAHFVANNLAALARHAGEMRPCLRAEYRVAPEKFVERAPIREAGASHAHILL